MERCREMAERGELTRLAWTGGFCRRGKAYLEGEEENVSLAPQSYRSGTLLDCLKGIFDLFRGGGAL